MKTIKLTAVYLFALSIGFFGAILFGMFINTASGQTDHPMPPPMAPQMGLSGICGDADYLYVMAGGKLMVYQLSDMSLMKSASLPDLPAQPKPQTSAISKTQPPFPPPHGGGPPHGLWVGNHFLYVLAGPMIYEYSIPDLVLVSSNELPKPELPKQGN
jgi:hypothetical protein